jgi:hypothetical protein
MATLDRHIVASFLRLKAPEFEPYLAYIKSVHQKALEDMSTVSDPDIWKQLQGRARLAKELLDYVESSATLATKFESRLQQPL